MGGCAHHFESAFMTAVNLGNNLERCDPDADLRDIADGLLAGALQFWLYSRQPCGDPRCEQCLHTTTAEGRMHDLWRFAAQLAAENEHLQLPVDPDTPRIGVERG